MSKSCRNLSIPRESCFGDTKSYQKVQFLAPLQCEFQDLERDA